MNQSYGVRLLEQADYDQCITLTDQVNWGFDRQDFKFMTDLEKEGCFVAADGNKIIGLLTSASFGWLGWVGNVIVDPERRREGIGAALVKKALNYLGTRSVKTVGLYAYTNVVPFYETLGFKRDKPYSYMICDKADWKGGVYTPLQLRDLPEVVELDEDCFGTSRKRLLEAIYELPQSLCTISTDETGFDSYLMARRWNSSAEIGPWVSQQGHEEKAFQLLRSMGPMLHGVEAHIGVPADREDLVSFLSNLGFKEDFPLVRMYKGGFPEDGQCALAVESLERG
jgi:predicted N-acetyltransferase YhbS